MLTSTILLLLLAGAEPAASETAPPPIAEAAAPARARTAAERDAEVVCVTVTPSGTLFSQKICHTRKQWKRLEARRRRAVDEAMEPGSESRTGRRE
ncbi:MAG: hypothetical protein GC145_10820 [Caulobacter sp.]|nr:hypothetical protein [Caulobacter sp.]